MKSSPGYIAITSVLVLSALFLSVSISIASRGITASDTSHAQHMEMRARYVAESCIEQGLLRLQNIYQYAGGESIALGDALCVLMPIEGTVESSRTLHAYSMIEGYTYRVEAVVSMVGPDLEMVSFRRVDVF